MLFLRRTLAFSRSSGIRPMTGKSAQIIETDSCGIPLRPSWSVNALLSSYPTPTISPATINRLHDLSALIPPAEGTKEHETLTREMGELVRLVEAVKLVDVAEGEGVPDGRVWAQGTGIKLEQPPGHGDECVSGAALLRHAARTSGGLYAVHANKTR